MLSLPKEWDYSMNGLVAVSKEKLKAIRNILRELEDNKYLIRTRMQGEHGKFYYDYSIYEISYNLPPYYHKGYANSGSTQKEIQTNTNIINTNNKDDKIDKTKNNYDYSDLTQKLIELGYIESNSNKLSLYDELFEELLNKYSFTDLTLKTRYIVSSIKNRNFKDENNNLIGDKYIYFKTSLLSNINRMEDNPEELWTDDDMDFEK